MKRRMTPDQLALWEAWKAEGKAARRAERAVQRSQTPVVTFTRPRCPKCRSTDCVVQRTEHSDQELLQQRFKCRACGKNFIGIAD